MRVGRGTLAASFATVTAAFSHALAGSDAPGAVGVVLSFAFGVLVCTALAGRRITVPRLALAVLLSQGLFHLLFGIGAGPAQDWSSHVGHHGSVVGILPQAVGDAGAAHGAHDGWMWMAHLAAAAVTIGMALWGVRLGRALIALLDRGLRHVVAHAVAVVVLPRRRAAVVLAGHREGTPLARLLLGRMRHRGPPVARVSVLASA